MYESALPPSPGALVARDSNGRTKLIVASAAARVVAEAMRGRFARCPIAGAWHRFTGAHWEPAPGTAEVHQALTTWLYGATEGVGFTPRYADSIVTLIERGDLRPLPPLLAGAIPFRNGILDIATRELHPVAPDTAQTWSLPYEYTPSADCPRVRRWLTTVVDGDEPTVQLLRAWFAALITGRSDLQRFLHLPGPGGTGKGTFMRVAEALVGAGNTVSTDLRTLERNQFEVAALYGKRLALIAESDKYGGSVNTLKLVTGEDAIRLERKHVQQSGNFVFRGQVLIASNEPLLTTDLSSGLERRRITVNFNRQATNKEREAWRRAGGEAAVLHTELAGIVNWALGLSPAEVSELIAAPPERTQTANLEALTAGNPVAGWLVECCAPESGTWCQIGERDDRRSPADGEVYFKFSEERLYPSYLAWSRRTGREPLAQRRFSHAVVDMARTLGADVLKVRRGDGQGIQGLRLLSAADTRFSLRLGRAGDAADAPALPTPPNQSGRPAPVGPVSNSGEDRARVEL